MEESPSWQQNKVEAAHTQAPFHEQRVENSLNCDGSHQISTILTDKIKVAKIEGMCLLLQRIVEITAFAFHQIRMKKQTTNDDDAKHETRKGDGEDNQEKECRVFQAHGESNYAAKEDGNDDSAACFASGSEMQ